MLNNKCVVEPKFDQSRDVSPFYHHEDSVHERVANTLGELSCSFTENLNRLITSATGLSPSASHVIVAIGIRPGSTIYELSRMRQLDHSSMVRAIGKLEMKGLVSKKKNKSSDARAVSVELTESGSQAYLDILESRTQFLLKVISNLSTEEKNAIGAIFDKMKLNLDSKDVIF